jgi:hypothetical protein
MRFFAIFALSAAVLAPTLAAADPGQTQTAPASPVSAAASPSTDANLDQIECRTSPPPTGTRLGGSRECHTVRQWKQREQEAQDNLKQAQMNGHQFGLANPVSGTK